MPLPQHFVDLCLTPLSLLRPADMYHLKDGRLYRNKFSQKWRELICHPRVQVQGTHVQETLAALAPEPYCDVPAFPLKDIIGAILALPPPRNPIEEFVCLADPDEGARVPFAAHFQALSDPSLAAAQPQLTTIAFVELFRKWKTALESDDALFRDHNVIHDGLLQCRARASSADHRDAVTKCIAELSVLCSRR